MQEIAFFGNGNVLLNLIPFVFEETEFTSVGGYVLDMLKAFSKLNYEDNLKECLKKYQLIHILF